MKRTKAKIKQDIFEFIAANGIMTLATQSGKGPWVCTVYYGMDETMNLYIVTDPDSIHGKDIVKENCVAFNIFDSRQPITKPKKGVQGRGQIELVKGIVQNTKALLLWHKANPGVEKGITIKDIFKKVTDTKIYKITPTYVKFFNKELYGSEENGVWNT